MPDDLFTVSSGYYRPQRSWAKVIISQASVCPQGGCPPQCMLGYTPQDQQTLPHPPEQADPPDQTHTPQARQTPPGPGTPPGSRPHQTRQTPPEADFSRGVSASVHAGIYPPWTRQTPPHPPPRNRQTPRTRHTHPPSPDQADPPPPRKQTSAYGQRAAGKHPTGMHSCYYNPPTSSYSASAT